MNFFRDLLWKIQGIFLLVWYLIIFVLFFLLIPILVFLPPSLAKNFDQIVNKAALKLLRIIWCGIKLCFFIVFALILMLITPVLIIWPPLCVAIWVWAGSIKIF